MQKLSENVMEGYQEYVKFHPEADYSNLARDFMDYLMTDEAQKILKDNLQEIIESTGGYSAGRYRLCGRKADFRHKRNRF